jgi:hypothetical protein
MKRIKLSCIPRDVARAAVSQARKGGWRGRDVKTIMEAIDAERYSTAHCKGEQAIFTQNDAQRLLAAIRAAEELDDARRLFGNSYNLPALQYLAERKRGVRLSEAFAELERGCLTGGTLT